VVHVAIGAYLAAVGLLGVAGWRKVRDPGSVTDALAALGAPSAARSGRAVGAGEIGVAFAAFAWFGRPTALAVGVVYTALGLVALRLRRVARVEAVGCGCLGGVDAPVTAAHVALDLGAAAAAVAFAVARGGGRSLVDAAGGSIGWAVWVAALAVVGAAVAALVITDLPAAWSAPRRRAQG
jgi:hypothetical protein